MTLADAFSLALAIGSVPDCKLIAIGHFVPIEQIEPTTPWRISVEYRGTRHVITSGVHWDQIHRPQRHRKPIVSAAKDETQLLLF